MRWGVGLAGPGPTTPITQLPPAKSQPQTVTRCYIATSPSGEVDFDFLGGSLCVKGGSKQKLVCNFPSAFFLQTISNQKKTVVTSFFFRLLTFR